MSGGDFVLHSREPLGRVVNHLTAVSGVGSRPALATCETSQVLLAPGGFSRGSPVFAAQSDWPFSY